jgi:anion-transporting  ArsA/GET3 family ATPase
MGVLSEQRLWVVSGKGGVGKSTISAALALASATAGLRTLVCEINVQERISGFLERPEVGPELTQIDPNLWAVNVQPQEAMREYALMILKYQTIYKAVFENRVVRYFLRFVPSLQELVILGKILYHLREQGPDGRPRWDRIVMDAPATGHAISFLSVPQALLDTVPPGPMAREVQIMRDLLVDRSVTAAVLVSLPEEMPINETIELHRALSGHVRINSAAAVLNMFVGDRFQPGDAEVVPPSLRPIVNYHRTRHELSASARERLSRELQLPVVPVPRMYEPRVTRGVIERVASHLAPLWEARQ